MQHIVCFLGASRRTLVIPVCREAEAVHGTLEAGHVVERAEEATLQKQSAAACFDSRGRWRQ